MIFDVVENIEEFIKAHQDERFLAYVKVAEHRYFITNDRNSVILNGKETIIIKNE